MATRATAARRPRTWPTGIPVNGRSGNGGAGARRETVPEQSQSEGSASSATTGVLGRRRSGRLR